MSGRFVLLACGAWLSMAGSARAAELSLELVGCDTLSPPALREHLDLELATLDLSRVSAQLTIRCEADAAAIVLTRASGARFPVEVRVDLRDTARAARERLIALAATELVAQAERARASDAGAPPARHAPQAAPEAAPPPPMRDRDSAPSSTSTSRQSELFLAGSMALDGAPQTTLWGGSLGAVLGLGQDRRWSLLLDTRFERGQVSAELATVRWSSLSGFAGANFRSALGVLRPALGLGVRAGWLALSADAQPPHEGRSLTAPWVGVALPVRLGIEAGSGVRPFVGAEAGYVLLPVRGNLDDGSPLIEHRGVWLAGNIGVAVGL